MKNVLKTMGVVLLLIFIALCFGLNASMNHYQITLSNFLIGTTNRLPADFSLNISVTDQIVSVIFIIAWAVVAFISEKKRLSSGKKQPNTIFIGMMIYSALPFIGLIGYPFFINNMKAGIMLLGTLIWGYPFFPLLITKSSIEVIIVPLGIAMFVMPLIAIIAKAVAKKLQY